MAMQLSYQSRDLLSMYDTRREVIRKSMGLHDVGKVVFCNYPFFDMKGFV